MTKTPLISQKLVKSRAAAAILEAQDRNGWSKSEIAEALGCCRTTICNRLDTEDHGKQMTVHELLRSVQSDGPKIANKIFELVGHKLAPAEPIVDATCDRAKESRVLGAALSLSIALADDGEIDVAEIKANRATIENARDALDALLTRIAPRIVA